MGDFLFFGKQERKWAFQKLSALLAEKHHKRNVLYPGSGNGKVVSAFYVFRLHYQKTFCLSFLMDLYFNKSISMPKGKLLEKGNQSWKSFMLVICLENSIILSLSKLKMRLKQFSRLSTWWEIVLALICIILRLKNMYKSGIDFFRFLWVSP